MSYLSEVQKVLPSMPCTNGADENFLPCSGFSYVSSVHLRALGL